MESGHQVVISEAELQERIRALGAQISKDYAGRVVHCVGVLESGVLFTADLLRAISGEVRCQFVKPYTDQMHSGATPYTQIFYSPEIAVQGEHILLCLAIVSTGLTTDFLIRHFMARGAATVAVCGLLDRPDDRRVQIDVAYSGFRIGAERLSGYGLDLDSREVFNKVPFLYAVPAK
jgi:hypoxanthine phosphoribosyltransferase